MMPDATAKRRYQFTVADQSMLDVSPKLGEDALLPMGCTLAEIAGLVIPLKDGPVMTRPSTYASKMHLATGSSDCQEPAELPVAEC